MVPCNTRTTEFGLPAGLPWVFPGSAGKTNPTGSSREDPVFPAEDRREDPVKITGKPSQQEASQAFLARARFQLHSGALFHASQQMWMLLAGSNPHMAWCGQSHACLVHAHVPRKHACNNGVNPPAPASTHTARTRAFIATTIIIGRPVHTPRA